MRAWKDVATIVKPRNVKGRFVARCAADFPFMLREGDCVALVPPQTDLPRHVVVDFSQELSGSTYEVGFAEITDETQAHALSGCHCLMRRDEIDDAVYAEEPATWLDWAVREENGERLGTVASLLDNPGQALLEVQRDDGAGFAYIPVVDAIVVDVDVENRVITVCLPNGLLDL